MQTIAETLLEWSSSAAIHEKISWRLTHEDCINSFPESLQPLGVFIFEQQDVVKSANALDELKQWILLQSLYHYCQDLATNKLGLLTEVCTSIITSKGDFDFSNEQKQIASSIIVDEGYHSFLALAIRDEISKLNKIHYIKLPDNKTVIESKLEAAATLINPANVNSFRIVIAGLVKAVMSAEITFLLEAQSEVNPPASIFYRLQKIRQHDETRHLCFFLHLLELYWQKLHINVKADIMPAIQLFVEYYKNGIGYFNDEFITRLLIPLSVSKSMLNNALLYIKDKQADYNSEMYSAMLSLLNQSKILS